MYNVTLTLLRFSVRHMWETCVINRICIKLTLDTPCVFLRTKYTLTYHLKSCLTLSVLDIALVIEINIIIIEKHFRDYLHYDYRRGKILKILILKEYRASLAPKVRIYQKVEESK